MPTRHEYIQLAEGGLSAVATGLGQPELVPMIVAGGEGINEGLDLYDEGRMIVDEFGNDDEFINNTQTPEMSNKSQRTTSYHGAPGATARTTKVPTVTTYAHKPAHAGYTPSTRVSLKRSTPVSGKLNSALGQDQKFFDSNLLISSGENRLTSLNVKLGKQVYPDCITPFLQALNGHGKVRMQFGGRCISKIGKRHTSTHLFRHNLAQAGGGAYPTPNLKHVLNPGNPVAFFPSGDATSGGSNAIGTTSMRDILTGKDYYAPYNISDLEDLSWNLNKLKLGRALWAQSAGVPAQKFQVPVFQLNSHNRTSAIFDNNDIVATIPSTATDGVAPYRYNAVFNKGSVHYDFMNKGTGGAKVEIIVYRLKKANQLSTLGETAFSANDHCHTTITAPIAQGYMDTQLAAAGTDALNGKIPALTDVYQDAKYPLLPSLKKTKQIDLPYVEVVRQTFAMTSGSRRELTIDLPGEVYDPNNQPGTGPGSSANIPPILNKFTYVIFMSVCGVICTDEVTPASADPEFKYLVGDMISAANIQFYGTYTEHMGSCQYKTMKDPNLYSQGALLAPATGQVGFGADVPITMIDQQSAVRIPQQNPSVPQGGGTNLRNDFAAAAQP